MSTTLPTYGNEEHGNEPYIHLKWNDYRDIDMVQDSELTSLYKQKSKASKARFKASLGGIADEEIAKIVSQVTGLYDTWNSPSTGKEMEKALVSDIQETIKSMNDSNLYTTLHHKKIGEISKNVEGLNEAFLAQAKVMNDIEGFDSRIADYYKEKMGKSISSFNGRKIIVGNGLESLAQTSKVHNSVIHSKENWAAMEVALKKAQANGKVPKKVSIKSDIKGNKAVSKSVEEAIGDTIGHLNNIKGEILEIGFTSLLRANIDDLVKTFSSTGAKTGTVSQDGDSTVFDSVIGRKVTRKSDIGLSFEVEKTGIKIDVGFSAKAQFKNGPKKKTSFLKTSYEGVLKRAEILDSDIEYRLSNLIAHGKYKESIRLRKLVAAHSALSSIGGIERLDEVYFMVYLDKIISLPEMLDEMSTDLNSMLNLEVNRTGLVVQKRMATKWQRSHETSESIRKLAVTISG